MLTLRKYINAIALMLIATQTSALTLPDCTRTTHISHGGQEAHRDLGEGRVMWKDWWSQEGTSTAFAIVDCASGTTLTFITAEERMNARPAFDRTDKAMDVIALHQSGSRVFATFERIAADLADHARDIDITTRSTEPCACAALYPDLRGTKTEFKLAG